MALTLSNLQREDAGSQVKVSGLITFDSSYATSGEEVAASLLGLAYIEEMSIEDSEGYTFDCDVQAGGATALVKAYWSPASTATSTSSFTGTAITTAAVVLKDSDTAATDGVAVYLHTKDGILGWMEFVSPTNADGKGTLSNGGSKYMIFDSDGAATDGVAIYFDEDATNLDDRLQCVSPSDQDIYVPVNANKFIRIKDNDTAASDGVQVYFDEDATNSYNRLLFISPTNTSGTAATDDVYTPLSGVDAGSVTTTTAITARSMTEVTAATSLSTVAVNFYCLGK